MNLLLVSNDEVLILMTVSPTVKRPINQCKPVQQSRQQALKAYCSNIYNCACKLEKDNRTFELYQHRRYRKVDLRQFLTPFGGRIS